MIFKPHENELYFLLTHEQLPVVIHDSGYLHLERYAIPSYSINLKLRNHVTALHIQKIK